MNRFTSALARWSAPVVGGTFLLVAILYSAVDRESIPTDSAEILLPVLCGLGVIGFARWLRGRSFTVREIGIVSLGYVSGGLSFVLLVGWILLIQGLDGDVPPEPAYTLLNGAAIGMVASGLLVAGYLRLRREKDIVAEQNERLESLASIVAHDLRNPLNVALLRLRHARETDDLSHLDNVEAALERMEALIDDLLSLTKQNRTELALEPVRLDRLAKQTWRTFPTGDNGLTIDTDTAIRADPIKLQQVLENLFRNAVEHNESNVELTVGTLDDGFYVQDDGDGIPPKDRRDVFEPGYTTSSNGTGLGLEIVDRIVRLHGWDVTITGSATGGTRFEIRGVEFTKSTQIDR